MNRKTRLSLRAEADRINGEARRRVCGQLAYAAMLRGTETRRQRLAKAK